MGSDEGAVRPATAEVVPAAGQCWRDLRGEYFGGAAFTLREPYLGLGWWTVETKGRNWIPSHAFTDGRLECLGRPLASVTPAAPAPVGAAWAVGQRRRVNDDCRDGVMLRNEESEVTKRQQEDVAMYLIDRADQYDTKSPCWIALADAAHNIVNGSVEAGLDYAGDDPAQRVRVRKWRRPSSAYRAIRASTGTQGRRP